MTDKGTCQKHGEFILAEGCPDCLAEKKGEVNVMVKVTAPDGAPEGEEKKVAGEIVKLAETLSEIQGVEKPTAIALRPGEDMEVHSYFEQAMKLLEYAKARVIATVEDVKVANDDLAIISKIKKAMEAKRKEYLEPLKAQTEAIRGTYDYLMLPILEADKITKGKMLAYDAEVKRKRAEQEEVNRLRMEAAQKEMELNGELSEPVGLVEVSPEAPTTIRTDMGMSGQTDHWKYEVFDFALLPDEYKVADSAMLNAIAKKHHDQKQIPGVRFYNEPYIAVRPR